MELKLTDTVELPTVLLPLRVIPALDTRVIDEEGRMLSPGFSEKLPLQLQVVPFFDQPSLSEQLGALAALENV